MPQVKGMRLPKLAAQPAVTNEPTVHGHGKRATTRNGKVIARDPRVWTTPPSPVPGVRGPEWDIAIFRGYRQNLARCEKDQCYCVCRCHTGESCDIEEGLNPRTHTPGHRPISVVVVDPLTGTRDRKEIRCHDTPDSILDTPYHFRKMP